jgi:aspartate ammonia-lyase
MILTALLPFLGYERATELIATFHREKHANVRAFLEVKLGRELVEKLLSPYALTALGYRKETSPPR